MKTVYKGKALSNINTSKELVSFYQERIASWLIDFVKLRFAVTRPPIKYILDITIAYPNGIPLSLATIGFGTREKCDIAVHYNVFMAEDVSFWIISFCNHFT